MKFIKKEKCSLNTEFVFFKKPEAGFFSVYFIFFLSLLSIFIFCFAFIFYASQSKDAFRTACATDAVELQKDIIKAEKTLFLMNLPSTAIRLRLISLYAALLITPPPGQAAIIAQISETKIQQNRLAATQKLWIQTTQAMIALKMGQIALNAHRNNQKIKSTMNWYLRIISFITPSHIPKMAVRPDSIGGTAPNYELEDDFDSKQRVELIWQNIFWVIERGQTQFNPKSWGALPAVSKYGLKCIVEPAKENSEWTVKIKMDKS